MNYLLMLYLDESAWPHMTDAERAQGEAAYAAYTEALRKAGVLVGTNRLQPIERRDDGAARRRQAAGARRTLSPTRKEQLGGYYLIDAPDLDAALAWAARCPAASHGVGRGAAGLGDVTEQAAA